MFTTQDTCPEAMIIFGSSHTLQSWGSDLFIVHKMRSTLFLDPTLLSRCGGIRSCLHSDLGDGCPESIVVSLHSSVGTGTTLCSVVGRGRGRGRGRGLISREGARTKHCRRRLMRGEHAFNIYGDQPPGLPEVRKIIDHIHLT